jgi:hypothetical protein
MLISCVNFRNYGEGPLGGPGKLKLFYNFKTILKLYNII